jgi:hypothetical protein
MQLNSLDPMQISGTPRSFSNVGQNAAIMIASKPPDGTFRSHDPNAHPQQATECGPSKLCGLFRPVEQPVHDRAFLAAPAGRMGLSRCPSPPRSCAFAARTNPLAGPLTLKCDFATQALANLRNIPGRLLTSHCRRWQTGHDCGSARLQSRVRSLSV